MKTQKIYRAIFMGTPGFAVPILQTLIDHPQIEVVSVVTQPDKKTGRGKTMKESEISKLGFTNNIEVRKPERIKKNPKLLDQIKELGLDFIVVAAYGKILPKKILDIPKFGTLNIHGSILPRYRGASPVSEAILNGDKQTGVTLMKMDETMDTGPIISTSEVIKIDPTDTTATLSKKLSNLGAKLLNESIVPYLEGELTPKSQNDGLASYTKLVSKTDGQINWQMDANYIERQIRAYTPWPSTYTFWGDKRIKVLEGKTTTLPDNLKPGEISNDGDLIIGTNESALKVTKLQLEGKGSVSGNEFLRGYPEIIGQTLE
ncbi:MAG: methionyl-tRNA formyltransferase [Patescibacteria group bacterium]|nr:methionyl-tRNA formyltransferase [Patescibacteria group bacterium]